MDQTDYTEAYWIDCDPGTDDAYAIALLIASKLNIVGITVSLGNATVDLCMKNTAKILGVLKHKIPVYKGSSMPISSAHFIGTDYYFGEDSLGDSKLFADYEGYTDCIKEENGHFALIAASKEAKKKNQKFKIVALAPMATLAIAIALDQSLADRVDAIYLMAGTLNGQGFTSLSTEFNFDRDPEAAHRVVRDYKNVIIVPIEIAPEALWSTEETVALRNTKSQWGTFFREITHNLLIDKDETKALIAPLYDGICAAIAINDAVIEESFEANVSVDLEGRLTRGNLTVEWSEFNENYEKYAGSGHPKKMAKIVKKISHDEYMKIVYNAFKYFE